MRVCVIMHVSVYLHCFALVCAMHCACLSGRMQKITLSANEPIDFEETNNVIGNLEIILVWTFLPAFQLLKLN